MEIPSLLLRAFSARLRAFAAPIRASFANADPRVCFAFWLLGLINNVLYVIILSAALDLVGPLLPKAIVLLADVVPSFIVKLIAPYFIDRLPYRVRIPLLVALSFVGMQMVAWQESLPARLFGVILASISSGLGELSFLGMTHFYGEFAIPFWGSGTGAAGLLGAGMYVAATSWLGLSVRASIMAFGFLPGLMLVAFFVVLPLEPLKMSVRRGYARIEDDDDELDISDGGAISHRSRSISPRSRSRTPKDTDIHGLLARLRRTKSLFLPYMLPLLLVYIAEYTINLGVAPTLLYELEDMPFNNYRDAYPMYNTVYQIGVFVSRSSTPFIRLHYLYPPALLQVVNLVLLVAHAMGNFIPNIWIIFAIVFWEGILGGMVYVNTFAEVSDSFEGADREFSLGAVTVSDSAGICVAGFVALALEPFLCGWQLERGRMWCRMN